MNIERGRGSFWKLTEHQQVQVGKVKGREGRRERKPFCRVTRQQEHFSSMEDLFAT
jgi:hypothetical protein